MNLFLERQNKLWEGSRMFLPEHKEALLQHDLQKQQIPAPQLDEQQVQYLCYKLQEASIRRQPICITYFTRYGIKRFSGIIDQLDLSKKTIYVMNNEEEEKISFTTLIHVE